MSKQHILILGDVDSLKEYLDFFENSYSIITSTYESEFMPYAIKFAAKAIYTIDTPSHFDATCFENNTDLILQYAAKIQEEVGKIDRVICTHEHTVLPAASVRSYLNLPGLKEDKAVLLRNKNEMKKKVKEFGLRIPQYVSLEEDTYEETIDDLLNKFNKIVLKPADQAGSSDILITNDKAQANQHAKKLLKTTKAASIEEFVEAPLMHFDGVIQEGDLRFLSVAKYIGNCYDFVHNRKSISTLLVNDPELYRAAKTYVEDCLQALDIKSLVFHLEVFCTGPNEFTFLEIAGRYPGAGTTDYIKKYRGYDLVQASYDIDCLIEVETRESLNLESNYAMVLIPSTVSKTIKITGIQGLDKLPFNVVGSEFSGPGTIVEYSSIDAFKPIMRMFISDTSEAEVMKSVHEVVNTIKFDYKEVE